jgi:hypothetical protein
MHPLPGAILAPLAKVVIDDPPRGQVMGQHAPRAATTQYVEESIQDLALGVFLGPSSGFGLGYEMFDQSPFFIAEISRIRLSRVHARYRTRSHSAMGNFLDSLSARLYPLTWEGLCFRPRLSRVMGYSLLKSERCPRPDGPMAIMTVMGVFAPLCSKRVFASGKLLRVGAILAPGNRTVTAVLRVLGNSADAHFQNYHRVLNRAPWAALDASRRLLERLLDVFVPQGPVVMGSDETIERRRGERIAAKGVYRAPVRSSHAHFVKASGLRWGCLMVLARIPWVDRVWALPFLTVLAPSARDYQSQGRRPHSRLDRARQMVRLARRWLPSRELVVVGDSPYAALEWLAAVRERACVITRLRLDAALYAPAPPRKPKQNGRPRKKGMRLPTRAHRVAEPTTPWKLVTVAPGYGQKACRVHIASATAVW